MGKGDASNQAWSGAKKSAASGANKSGQDELYEKLRTYETRRRLAYSSKHDSISLYWKSYCDLLSASLRETGRAQRIVLGTSHAYAMYAEAMQGIYDDTFLDEKGNIAGERNKNKKKKALARKKKEAEAGNDIDKSKTDAVSVLKEIREAQNDLASRFEESSKNMDEEIAELIGSLLDTTRESFNMTKRLGSSILVELEKTENEVTNTWDNYLNNRSGLVGGNTTEEASPKNVIDPWVVEMQYRVAVTYQNLAWEKGNQELTKLFAQIIQDEIDRRMNLREFLVAFAQRQQRLFLSIPSIQNKVLEELVGKEMSRNEMNKIVHTIIEDRAMKYKKSAHLVTDAEDDFADFNLESPLTSDLLSKAKVVLRRGEGGDWTLSLAVMSADSFLHMFDIDSPRVKLTTSPEVAFTLLAPALVIPTIENINSGKSNFDKSWSYSLTPTESMVLAKCRVKKLDDNSFEMIESVSSAVSSKFALSNKATTRRRMQIQTPTKEETDDWIQILTA
mmetsp:Transcript_46358/g.96439  ORF Transcript_46358/g.96439 Transcript_46358/m.96439 type:complete len:505 (-) Transcript_46358:275-1789(-)|eukprot:CAMPEP_0201183986 /NCGR_PEP_ID=MMETSP0851-20130426/125061_1 /ASSEMBLY_ACC=CAM_ASM_000631 /TAXON_ID=183588 /ORGANISM="Pseudo-nitzschia fraudulenta, Strain WWA7" /LENGTH=504 /DNA_ID=CAMNT_0047468875 /DNA_START=84 /DNA_END=1598 /DNA_ORIENTATION=-